MSSGMKRPPISCVPSHCPMKLVVNVRARGSSSMRVDLGG